MTDKEREDEDCARAFMSDLLSEISPEYNDGSVDNIADTLVKAIILSRKMNELIEHIKVKKNYVSVKNVSFEYCLENYVDNTKTLINMLNNTTTWLEGEVE